MTDETELDDAIAAWDVDGAPAGFADRALQTADARVDGAPRSRRRSGWRWVAVAAGMAVAASLLLWRGQGRDASGRIEADQRSTHEIPRATLVADTGSRLAWAARGDAVEVEQFSGRVFYRVEKESVFAVLTPLGRVDVEGTSFEVEIEAMKSNRSIKSAAAGMAVAAAVTVSLYEGRVVVAGEHPLTPGQSARLRPDRAPETFERQSVAALQRENRELRTKLEAERHHWTRDADVASVTAGAAPPPAGDKADPAGTATEEERVRKCALSMNSPACPLTEPSQAVLERRADCGVVLYDRPDAIWSPEVDFTELADLTGLTDAELEKLDEGTRSFHEHLRGEFAKIYEELGGEPELAAKLSTAGLTGEIELLMREQDSWWSSFDDTSRQYAAALAGRVAPPNLEDVSAGERAALLFTTSGDLYEEWLADYIGAARATELRRAKDGWPGARGMNGTANCPD